MISSNTSIIDQISQAIKSKPKKLKISELKWRYLVRSIIRGKNILIVGPSGCGKTLAALCASETIGRKENQFIINLGSTQDPRTSLIGKTRFNKEVGTFFDESPFVKAIRTPNSVVILDEISRAHPEAWNIILSVLDELQRYLRLDEEIGGTVVKVAEGVSFIATANIGSEYTATRVMDRALMGRFPVKIEMDFLSKEEEINLLEEILPAEKNKEFLRTICEIVETTRIMYKTGKLSLGIPTRAVVEMAGLYDDGFSLEEIAEMVIYPDYSDEGDIDCERTIVKQIVQKYVSTR